MLRKWTAFEEAQGGPLTFANISRIHTGAKNVGPSWLVVFAPSWSADFTVAMMALVALSRRAHISRAIDWSWNSQLLHANTLCQALASALFKFGMTWRLVTEHGSWLIVFAPLYWSMIAQLVLHYNKQPDSRNRRPGFPVGLTHLVALVVSFKLEGILHYSDTSWASVLWPLWGLGGFLGIMLVVGICCGVPLLLRRDVPPHMALFLLAVLLLLFVIFMPALVSAVRLTLWLDGREHMSATEIMRPYLAALFIVLVVLLISVIIVLLTSYSRRPEQEPGDAEDPSLPPPLLVDLPKVLYRESSTLFRRVSDVDCTFRSFAQLVDEAARRAASRLLHRAPSALRCLHAAWP